MFFTILAHAVSLGFGAHLFGTLAVIASTGAIYVCARKLQHFRGRGDSCWGLLMAIALPLWIESLPFAVGHLNEETSAVSLSVFLLVFVYMALTILGCGLLDRDSNLRAYLKQIV